VLKNFRAMYFHPKKNPGDPAFWKNNKMNNKRKTGGNLRMIVNSKKVVMGSANFSSEDLLNAVSDGKGLRRVSTCTMSVAAQLRGSYRASVSENRVTAPKSKPENVVPSSCVLILTLQIIQVTGRIMAETGEMNGRIKVAYTMDVVTKPAVGSPQQQAQRAGSPGECLLVCEGNMCCSLPSMTSVGMLVMLMLV
jgi:hypothetical protein